MKVFSRRSGKKPGRLPLGVGGKEENPKSETKGK